MGLKFKLEFFHEPASSTWTSNYILLATWQMPDLEISPAPSYQWLPVSRLSWRGSVRGRDRDPGTVNRMGMPRRGWVWGDLRAKSSGAEFPINSDFPGVSVVKNPPAMQETQDQYLGGEDPLEKETATHSSIPAWEIPQTEKPGGLQLTGSQRVVHNCATEHASTHHTLISMTSKTISVLHQW